jgi:Mrp family chromosome partitioning ATPase
MSKNFELLQQMTEAEGLFHTSGNPPYVVHAATPNPQSAQGEEFQRQTFKSSSLPMRWPGLIKEKARSWKQQLEGRTGHRRTGADAITREEEIKLVERVFPARGNSIRQVVLFSGIDEEAGCPSVCIRTSEILAARAEGPVCLVDVAIQSPTLHRYLGVENDKGLAEALLESGPLQDFAQRLREDDLWILPAGVAASHLSAPLSSDHLRSRMAELRAWCKYVVIHSSPLNLDAVSISLSRLTDGVVLVLEAGSTPRDRARHVKKSLEAASVNIIGAVLNNRTFPIPEALYRRL